MDYRFFGLFKNHNRDADTLSLSDVQTVKRGVACWVNALCSYLISLLVRHQLPTQPRSWQQIYAIPVMMMHVVCLMKTLQLSIDGNHMLFKLEAEMM